MLIAVGEKIDHGLLALMRCEDEAKGAMPARPLSPRAYARVAAGYPGGADGLRSATSRADPGGRSR